MQAPASQCILFTFDKRCHTPVNFFARLLLLLLLLLIMLPFTMIML